MIEGKQMTENTVNTPPPGLKLADIYYVLFRKKWLMAAFLAASMIAGVIAYFVQRPTYFSEAKLLVRYVVDTKSVATGAGAQMRSPDNGGESIINSELEILNSMDLCKEVAELVGPEKILGKVRSGESNLTAAAVSIYRGLTVDNLRRSNIILVRFSHRDPSVCQLVLGRLIESYFKRHKSIHRDASSLDDALAQQAAQLRTRIMQSEEDLRQRKAKAKVLISVDDDKKTLSEQLSRLRQEFFNTEAQVAQYRSMAGVAPAGATAKDEKEAADVGLPADKIADYRFVCGRLELLRNKEFEFLSEFTDENPQVKRLREQLADTEQRKKALETEFPKLVGLYVAQGPTPAGSPADTRFDPMLLPALESKLKMLSNYVAQVSSDIAALDNVETAMLDIQRQLELNKKNYMNLATGLEEARVGQALNDVKMSNIQTVQTPSPPVPNVSKQMKSVAGVSLGLLIMGLALAFLLELLVDTTVRRPGEFETKLHIPLFLSIPKLSLNGHAKMLPFPGRSAEVPAMVEPESNLHNTWDADHPLRLYIDGLRDRTLIHFDGNPHKPKLIGITSCGEKAGVTSIAAGLAGALSETGDGNVLLLNLNFEAEAVHPFYRGELTCDLSDALESGKRQNGMVLQNLYVATAGNPSDPTSTNLPKQLARVMPQLRVSGYDYIVFDLPPTTPTTMTARLAGMMDLVILVVESEKDTQEAVKQAGKLLSRSKAPVSAVLNKVQNPVPLWLHKVD
jgi:polysaccharide biosynthesis transport protein